jgi:hypothetical protein
MQINQLCIFRKSDFGRHPENKDERFGSRGKSCRYYNYKFGRLFLAIHWLYSGFHRQDVIYHLPYFTLVV